MIKTRCITIGKPEKNSINEDAAVARKHMIAVSDGAGGGGLFADRWSKYLLKNVPNTPITSADQLDKWIESIWEAYYTKTEQAAKKLGGMTLDKFYDEGSFATLAVVWRLTDGTCQWITFGDSVVFHYNYRTKELHHSFTQLADFSLPPNLINCKDELNLSGFNGGEFIMTKDSFVFTASDALSHYILMMYELTKKNEYAAELKNASAASSKHSNLIQMGVRLPDFKFETEVIDRLRKAVYDRHYYTRWLKSLFNRGLLALDDYSLAVMYE